MKIASHEGFAYSPALKAKGGDWSYENLDLWLTNPQAFAAGTTMAFPGVPDIKKRADIIAFMRSKADNPAPFPEAAPAAAPPAAEAPAAEPPAPAAPEAAAPEAAPAAEPAPATPEAAPSAETPPAAPEEAPAAEPAPAAPEAAPSAETPPAAEAEPAPSEPSMGEPPSPSWPQPVYPDGPPAGAQ
jgi:cytochrome c